MNVERHIRYHMSVPSSGIPYGNKLDNNRTDENRQKQERTGKNKREQVRTDRNR